MFNNSVQFEFMGFEPDYEIRNAIAGVAEKLQWSAPSDSAVKVAIKKGKGVLRASCRIASKAGIFIANAASENPIAAIQRIEEKIGRQLEDWKKRRFSESSNRS